MAEERVQRRLAAILVADVVAYSRLMEKDEAGTLERLKALRADLIDPRIAADGGRIVKTMGDGLLVEFPSAVDAVRNALDIQAVMARRNADLAEDRRMEFRVGINLGDVIIEGDDIHGDGVNVAARLEGLCEPGGVYVSGSVFDQVTGKLDAWFDDLGEQTVKNLARPVRVFRAQIKSEAVADPKPVAEALTLPDKPSIAVLPFENMSGDPEQEFFADGISEDIITELSRLRGFFVIARNSSFIYKGQSIAISDVAHDLGVRYILEGSVRRAGNRIRVTAQLIEGDAGTHIWAERYDRMLDDIFELQDEITRQIVGALEPSLMVAEAERSQRQRPENLDAWGYVARAMPLIWTWSGNDYGPAETLLRKAIEIDPNYARAHSILAVGLIVNAWYGRDGPDDDSADQAFEEAKLAVKLDANDPWGHLALGFAYGYRRNSEDAFAEMEQALTLNPNFALAHGFYGLVLSWAGEAQKALKEIDLAERLSPRDVINIHYPTIRGVACFAAGDYEAAAAHARTGIRQRSDATGAHRVLAASCGQLDALEEAQATAARLVKLQPEITLRWAQNNVPIPSSEFLGRYVEGLRLARIPE